MWKAPPIEGHSDLPERPSRRHALARDGLKFEKLLRGHLLQHYPHHELHHGLWIGYETDEKRGVCQPDFVLLPPWDDDLVIVLEAKRTWKPDVEAKLLSLYAPNACHLFNRTKALTAQICRRMNDECLVKEWTRLGHLLGGTLLGNKKLLDSLSLRSHL